jgi:tetratricopeptide (TPR) repeat protein
MTFRKNLSIDSLFKIVKTSKDRRKVRLAKMRLNLKLDNEHRTALVKRLVKATDTFEKNLLKQRLWGLDLDKSYESLVKVIKTSKKIEEIRFAVSIIGKKRYKNGFPLLIRLLKDKRWGIRHSAALSLSHFKNQRALKPLVKAIKKTALNTTVCGFAFSLEGLDCTSIFEFLINVYISRPKDAMTIWDLSNILEKIDLRKISEKIKRRCVVKLHKGMQRAADIDRWNDLKRWCRHIEKRSHLDSDWEKSRCDSERRAMQKFLKKEPEDSYLLRKLASSYYEQGRFSEAEKPLARAYRLASKNALNIWAYALVLANLNRTKEAIQLLKRILRMSPKLIFSNIDTDDDQTIVKELKTDSMYNLAQCYLDIERRSEAKHWFKRYVAMRENGSPSEFTISQAKRKLASIG